MQKSKKMMVSLCGLALSSLFVLNNKSVVHADTTADTNQNNAISWNSDSDAAQNVQNTQKADDHQQNAQSVQPSRAEMSTVRSSSATPRTTNQNTAVQSPRVANVQDAQKTSPVVINNPANNKVHVHYVDANGNAVDNSSHDDNYDYDIDVTKTGQGSYNVPNGYTLNNPDGKYTISSGALNGTKLKGNTWTVPAQYQTKNVLSTGDAAADEFLRNHNSLQKDYALEVGHTAGDNDNEDYSSDLHPSATVNIYSDYHDMYSGSSDNSWIKKDNVSWYYNSSPNGIEPASSSDAALCERLSNEVSLKGLDLYYWTVDYRDMKVQTTPAYTEQHLPVAFVDSNNNIIGMVQNYTGKVGTTQNVSLTVPTGYKLADDMSDDMSDDMGLPTSVTFQDSADPLLIKVVPSGKTQRVTNPANNTINVNFVDQTTGEQVDTDTIDLTKAQNGINYYNVPDGYGADVNSYYADVDTGRTSFTDNLHTIRGNTVTVPVHESTTYQFVDPSDNAVSANGNTVDVTLTKPQSVNPAMDTRCQSQATRTIQINFPDGQIPEAYDGIVDKSGKLVQTVHFTRIATEDALTGNILQYGNWTSDNKDHNFIGFSERTLPKIPGYTLSIKPA